jgi:hypothetical protein
VQLREAEEKYGKRREAIYGVRDNRTEGFLDWLEAQE